MAPIRARTQGWGQFSWGPSLTPRPFFQEATWVFCDRRGCSVDAELIHPDGHHYADDDDFYCADCWVKVGTPSS